MKCNLTQLSKRMRKSLVYSFGLMLFMSQSVLAMKLAVLDDVAALKQSKEAQVFFKQQQKDLEADKVTLDTLKAKIETLAAKHEKNAEFMSQAELTALKTQVEDAKLEFDYNQKKIVKKRQQEEQELLARMMPKLHKATEQFLEKNTYDIVFNARVTITHAESVDITNDIVELLDKL